MVLGHGLPAGRAGEADAAVGLEELDVQRAGASADFPVGLQGRQDRAGTHLHRHDQGH